MSLYSGKCDIADILVMIHADGDASKIDFSKIKIFAANNDIIPLKIECEKDLVPYYPYLESYGSGSDGCMTIHLSEESYVDMEEKEHIGWYMEYVKKYARKCKRNKIEFTLDGVKKEVSWLAWDKNDLFLELFNRVKQDGQDATIDGLHDSIHDYYRKLLFDEMIRVGYEQFEAARWVYGWSRAFQMLKVEKKEITKDGERKEEFRI